MTIPHAGGERVLREPSREEQLTVPGAGVTVAPVAAGVAVTAVTHGT